MSDLISRQAAIEVIIKETYADGAYGYTDAKTLVDAIASLPSAQPELANYSPKLANNSGESTGCQVSKVKIPTDSFKTVFKPNGARGRTIRLHSYVVMLTEKDGCEVKAVRYDGYETKEGVHGTAIIDYPDWNIKGVWRLYDTDF